MNNYNTYNRIRNDSFFSAANMKKLCILYITIWSVFPPLQVGTVYRLAALGCMAIWLIFSFGQLRISRTIILSFVLVGMVVANTIAQQGTSALIKQIAIYMLVIFVVINSSYKEKWNELGDIAVVVLLLLIFSNFVTYREILINPQITRSLVRDDEELYLYYQKGVGGYNLIYPQVCMFAVGLQWTLSCFKRNKIKFTIGAIWVVSVVMLIFKSGYSIAVFTLVASTVILLFYKRKSSTLAVIVAVSMLFLGLYSIVKFEWLQNFLLDTFEGTTVTKKINDLIASAQDGTTEGSIYVRVDAYMACFTTFFQYPFTGGWLWAVGGGGHSAIMDMFATYGVLGGVIYTKILVYEQYARFKNVNDRIVRRTINAAITAIMLVATLDTVPYQFIAPILILIPLFLRDISSIRGVGKNENTMDSKFNTR